MGTDMTEEEKKYAAALGRRLRIIREARGLTQSQASQLYRLKTGKHGAGLVDLECGRSGVLPLLKLRCLKEIYEVSYDELLDLEEPGGETKKESFSEQLSRCMGEASLGKPYSLLFYGGRYIRRISEHENAVEFSALCPETGGWSRETWPREMVERFSGADFERQFSRLIFQLASRKEKQREIRLIRAEKRSGRFCFQIVDGETGAQGEEVPVGTTDQLLRYLEGYQRLGYEIELTGFVE